MKALTVLYDPGCPLCLRCRHWLERQPKYLAMRFIAQGSVEAGRRYPQLHVGEGQPVDDLIVVSDDGKVYRNTRAWVMCFYALREYRPLAFRLSHPALMPLARRAYAAISSNRLWLSKFFAWPQQLSDAELISRINAHTAASGEGCHGPNATACAVRHAIDRKRETRKG